ncbi:MAG: hypothetical protein JXR84_04215 [Anaerolineae bacterium]|nr:hypothetical protein [Anaerolineae bacterium]
MPAKKRNPFGAVLRLNAQNSRYLAQVDRDVAQAIQKGYEAARNEVLGIVEEQRRYTQLRYPKAVDREIARELARNELMLAQVEARSYALRSWILGTTPETWRDVMRNGAAFAGEQLGIAEETKGIRLGFNLALVDFNSVEFGLEEALRLLDQSQTATAAALRSGLRMGLIQGESFDDMVRRLMGKDASVFSRGATSAMLGARRNVIYANNAGRDTVYKTWGARIPGLMKQAIAAIDERTTDCCLRVHGQVRALNQPYELAGEPRFADRMDYPPFHWNCRTSSVAYMREWEDSAITTEMMTDAARAELEARDQGLEEIHPAHATSGRGDE